jgi:Ca2+-binding RTX toxin-like protein
VLAGRISRLLVPLALVAGGLTGLSGPAAAGTPSADLVVWAATEPDAMNVGDTAGASVGVDNLGPDVAEDVVLTVTIDDALVPVVPDDCSFAAGAVTCEVGDIPPGTGRLAPIAVGAVAPGALEVGGAVSSQTPDPQPGNDAATASVVASGEACDVVGTNGHDVLPAPPGGGVVCGLLGDDVLVGGPGDDALLGGGGDHDHASYAGSGGPVTVDLLAGTGTGNGEGDDTLAGIEWLDGSPFADSLSGRAADETFVGGGGADVIDGRAGDDVIVGGPGPDTLDGGLGGGDSAGYGNALRTVRVDLAAGTATGQGADTLEAIEDVNGSPFADVLLGNAKANELYGGSGTDVLVGRSGSDTLKGWRGADTLHAGGGDDTLLGGFGRDGCVQGVGHGTKAGCEVVAYAQYGDLVIFEPHVSTVGFGFHESLFHSAEILRPLGSLILNDNPGKYPDPPPPTDGPGYVVMGSRGRSTPATAATDIVVPRHGTMRAPVTGTVVEVAIYMLYCDRPDWKVIIRPLIDPDLRVLVLHMAQPHVDEGDTVVAGVTDIGVAVENDPSTAQENDYFPDQYPHVHIEVEHVGAVKGPCGA